MPSVCQPLSHMVGYGVNVNGTTVYGLTETLKNIFFNEIGDGKEYKEPQRQKKGKITRLVCRWRGLGDIEYIC